MDPNRVDKGSVIAAAHTAALEVRSDDIELLARSLRRYASVFSALDQTDLDGAQPATTNDPRVGW